MLEWTVTFRLYICVPLSELLSDVDPTADGPAVEPELVPVFGPAPSVIVPLWTTRFCEEFVATPAMNEESLPAPKVSVKPFRFKSTLEVDVTVNAVPEQEIFAVS
jgi:hypothetical protein